MTPLSSHIIFFSAILISWVSCQPSPPPELKIATAANMQGTIQALIQAFEQETGMPTRAIISSSGKLSAQIQAGAPYDLLISADLKYPQRLYKQGLSTAPPLTYAYGRLILWTRNPDLALSVETLSSKKVQHIALANPKTAPYGAASRQALLALGLWKPLQAKLVFGESIAQCNQFINTGAADLGLTSQAIVYAQPPDKRGNWQEIDSTLYAPLAQGAITLKSSAYPIQAAAFLDFLRSPSARKILESYGYKVPSEG